MHKFFFVFLFILPFYAFNQVKNNKNSSTAKPDETNFIIKGIVVGYTDGTVVSLHDAQNGAVLARAVIQKNNFILKGSLEHPDFVLLVFANQPPYVNLFLDNSNIKLTGVKDSIQNAKITGSPAYAQFVQFNEMLEPYEEVFSENAVYDSAAFADAGKICENFVRKNPGSFLAPLALIKYTQVADQPEVNIETLFNNLAAPVKNTPLSLYIFQQISEAKKNPIGTVLSDFSQPDTAGNALHLTSLRGKYVLIDFWASWCRPCRQENPHVVAAYNRFKDKNFTVLGVSLDQAKRAWIDAIRMDSLAWVHVSDLKGWRNSVAQQYQIFSIPQNFLIDPEGKIVAKNLRGGGLERTLTRIFN